MDSHDLKTWQTGKILVNLQNHFVYLRQLRKRMVDQGFPETDPLLVKTMVAIKAADDLEAEVRRLANPFGNLPQ